MDRCNAKQKKEDLVRRLKDLDSLLIAFSGGVDSTFLLAVAHQILGKRVLAATASSAAYPAREQEDAIEFVKKQGIRHVLFESDEINIPEYSANNPERCYYCKKRLCQELHRIAREKGMKNIAFAANLDDLDDYRPGIKAAEEMGIIEPLIDARLTKEEIRFLSKEMDLPTWDKPAMACLASRIPYGEPITEEKLKMVEEAEIFLSANDFKQFRVRHHGPVARIELEVQDMGRMIEPQMRKMIAGKLREIGFIHISLDLEGYVSGSMNRVLE